MILILGSVSLLTRLLYLGHKSFWIDECLAWGATQMGWLEMFKAIATGTPHPPVAFALMKLSVLLFGSSEFGIRLVIALITASAVIPVFRLTSRRSSTTGAFWAGLLWALSPFAVSIGQEAWVYGINLAISLWFVDFADSAWFGSKRALVFSIILGALGLLTQHIFVLSIITASILYFTIDSKKRIPLRKFIVLPIVLTLFYIPIFFAFSSQFLERSSRMASAGFSHNTSRLFTSMPLSSFFRVLLGGILPEISLNLFERPRMLVVYAVNGLMVLFLAIWPYFTKLLTKPEKKFLWFALLIPFGLFLGDSPSIRQLSIIWIPLLITSSVVFARYSWSGLTVSIFCLVMLVPYYKLNTYPYHQSDFRTAITEVEKLAGPDDVVVVFGGKSTRFVWECYSESDIVCLTPSGDNPFAFDLERRRVDPVSIIDSLITIEGYQRVWVILDVWGIPSISGMQGSHTLSTYQLISEHMQIGLIQK